MDEFTMVTKTCTTCGQEYQRHAIIAYGSTCGACVQQQMAEALQRWQAERMTDLPALVTARLMGIGLGPLELTADLNAVPVALKRALPREDVRLLLHGHTLTAVDAGGFHSFGLSGGQGIGKTMCLAALLRAWVTARLTEAISTQSEVPATDEQQRALFGQRTNARWVTWPSFAAWLKTTSTQDRGAGQIEQEASALRGCGVLVLDDIGRERLSRGGYDEDLAVATLDRIIDERSRHHLPMLWTSNLGAAQIGTRYGAALTSRLLGHAPMIEVPPLTDLRLSGVF